MIDAARFPDLTSEHCSICRGHARGTTDLHGEHVCGACLRRLNADQGAKRAIMFAQHD